MIAERLPQLLTFTKEEKRQLVAELQDELDDADDPTMQEPLKSQIVAELELRHQYYLEHPESAMTVEESRRRMRASRGK